MHPGDRLERTLDTQEPDVRNDHVIRALVVSSVRCSRRRRRQSPGRLFRERRQTRSVARGALSLLSCPSRGAGAEGYATADADRDLGEARVKFLRPAS